MLGQIWLGQIDLLICAGLAIYLFGKNPFWRGLGIILALTKPQLTFLPIFLTLLLEIPRDWFKLLTPSFLVTLISLFLFGADWPLAWINNATTGLPVHVWRLASMDVWRFGIILLPLPLVFRNKKSRLIAGLLVSALATPFYGVYSYIVFLLFNIQGWMVALSYAWLLAFFHFKETAMRFAWILPFAILVQLLVNEWKDRHASQAIKVPFE